jgi:hypothetical protein
VRACRGLPADPWSCVFARAGATRCVSVCNDGPDLGSSVYVC